jgi:hypothetical protein
MFARIVTMRLKETGAHEMTQTIEKKVLPVLRRQEGFVDEILFLAPGGLEAVGISLWERKENAEAYNRHGYSEVMNELSMLIEGTPRVQTFNVSNSTMHKIASRIAA